MVEQKYKLCLIIKVDEKNYNKTKITINPATKLGLGHLKRPRASGINTWPFHILSFIPFPPGLDRPKPMGAP